MSTTHEPRQTTDTRTLNAFTGIDPHDGARNSPALEALHTASMRVACERPPHGCGAPEGKRCVNLRARREPGEHPPATKIPHPRRLSEGQAAIPEQRQIEAAPDHDRLEVSVDEPIEAEVVDDDVVEPDPAPWKLEPADDREADPWA